MRRRGRRSGYRGKLPGTPWSRALQRARAEGVVPTPQTRTTFRVPSSGRATWYEVTRDAHGGFSCSCPAGSHGKPCKHIASIYLLGGRLDESYQWEAPWVGGAVPGAHALEEPYHPGETGAGEDEQGIWHPHDW